MPFRGDFTDPPARGRRGFTLLELLVAMSIVAILISLLLPGVASVREKSRAFKCQMNLRSVGFDFHMFADPALHGDRGEDEALPNDRFRLETFQESQYRIDEFWGWPGDRFTGSNAALGAMACTEVRGNVAIRAETPCRSGAVQPPESVSYAFNLRFDRPEISIKGQWVPSPSAALLSDRILQADHPLYNIPLLWDIDGAVAAQRDITPHYSAAPHGSDRPYSDGWTWFPALRHQGQMQIAALDGSVRGSVDPLADRSWQWGFQP